MIQRRSLDFPRYPSITVQVSQHSSIDNDLYSAYISSLSTQADPSSFEQHPDSGLGESSPEPDPLWCSRVEKDGVVPDSQSLPGSSSYVPPSSTSLGSTDTHRSLPATAIELRRLASSISSRETASELLLTNESPAVIEDSIDKSSLFEVAVSLPSSRNSHRSKSEPVPSSIENSWPSSTGSGLPSLVQSVSDSAIIDRNTNENTSSSVEVPSSTHPQSERCSKESEASFDQTLVLQTQLLLTLVRRGTRISTTPFGRFKHISIVN